MHRRFLPSFRFTIILALLALPAAARADEWPVPFGPSHEPEPYKYDAKVLKQAPPEFLDDAPACMVYYGMTHLVQPDGTTASTTHEIMRLNGKKAIENLGEYRSITFDPAYQKLTLHVARVIKADGKVVPIEPKHVKLRDTTSDYANYDQEKELVISFPGLEVGDLYEVKWTTVGQHPENQGHFFRQYLFGSANYPILRDNFCVRLPKEKPLKYKILNGEVPAKIREEGPNRYYQWTVTNHAALPRDEDLPPREELRLGLVCSTFKSWAEVGQWRQKLRKECWECTPAIKQTVAQLTAGLKSPEQQAAALTHWVRKKIRYVSVVSATHRYTPSKPGMVATNLYGDCKDQAQLLSVMLKEAGLKVYQVTLGQRGDGQVVPDVPSPWGTHAILLTRIGGKDHWIDTTATFAGWDFLPHADRDRAVYVTDEEGHIELLRTPKARHLDNRYAQTTVVMVQPDGTSLCKRQATYYGFAAMTQRNRWIDTPAGERLRVLNTQLQDAHNRSQLLNLKLDPANLTSPDQPVYATIDFQINQHFTGKNYLEAVFSDAPVWNRLLAYHADLGRKNELDLWAPFESIHRYIVALPPHFRFDSDGFEKVVTSKWGSFLVRMERDTNDDRRAEIYFYTTLEEARVKPADFAEFRKFHQQVQENWRVWLGIVPTRDLDDALPLEAVLAWNPRDLATVKILAALYKQHGKTDAAKRVLQGALVYYPKNKSVWELFVQTTATLEDEEAVYRQMVQRFPDEKKYVLALANTCMTRGDHAEAKKILEPLTKAPSAALRSEANFYLAKSVFRQKQPAKALEYLHLAKKEDAAVVATVPALELWGQVYEQLAQPDAAAQSYRQALKVQPDARKVMSALIRLEVAAGRVNNTLALLKRFAPLVKNDVTGLNQAAATYMKLGRLDDALDLALQARDLVFHAETQKILGLIYFQKGSYAKAVFHLDRANPDADVLAGLIKSHLAQGQLDAAVTRATALASLADAEPQSKLAAACAALGKRKAALLAAQPAPAEKRELWLKALDHLLCAENADAGGRPPVEVKTLLEACFADGIKLGPAYGLRAQLALESGHIKLALADADLAIQLSPKEDRGYYVRGRIRHETGHQDALADLQQAAELSGRKNGHMLHWLAAAQFDAGECEQAIATQQEALKLLPGHLELVEQLQRFEKGGRK